MKLLINALRFIVQFLSYLIILASAAAGVFAVLSGSSILDGIVFGVGGLLASSLLFGFIALLFGIHDHLAAIRKYVEEGALKLVSSDQGERIEPNLS